MSWRRILIEPNAPLFNIFQKAIRLVEYPKIKHVIKIAKKNTPLKFMFIFKWTNKEVCQIELFEEVKDD